MSTLPSYMNSSVEVNKRKCFLLQEASSSKTSLHLYDEHLNLGFKYTSSAKIRDFAQINNSYTYYNTVVEKQIIDQINDSDCDIVNWLTLATGGMRKLQDLFGESCVQEFYSAFKETFLNNTSIRKDFHLVDCKTLTPEEEGIFAIRSHAKYGASFIFDLGGATGQITSRDDRLVYSDYLGKDLVKGDIGAEKLQICFNDKHNYIGDECRSLISSYIDSKFIGLSSLNITSNNSMFFGISNFFNLLNDLCNTYMPYVEEEEIILEPEIVNLTNNLCVQKEANHNPIAIEVVDYKNIADTYCQYWGDWTGKKGFFAADMCFSANYNYQILKTLGFEDSDSIYISGKDWAEGAVETYMYQSTYMFH